MELHIGISIVQVKVLVIDIFHLTGIFHRINGKKLEEHHLRFRIMQMVRRASVFLDLYILDNGLAPGSLSGSGSVKLTTIPRATTPTVSPASQVMGESIVINLPRASSGFTHKLTYKFGTASGVISSSATTSATFLVPESFAEQIPNSEKGTGTITCQTYNGATLIGTKTVNFTAVVPDGIVPVINNVTIEEAVVGRAISGVYLQNKSQLRVVTDAQGTMGSTIAKYEVLVDGVIHSGADIISQIVTSHGNVPINVTVTDSRGRTASKSQNVEFEEYYNPTIHSFCCSKM